MCLSETGTRRELPMFRSIVGAVTSLAVFAGIASCQSGIDFPATIEPPAGATDYHAQPASPDNATYEFSFKVEAEANSNSVVRRLELQLTKAGFRPCGKAESKWEIVQHAESATEQNRFLKFYDAPDPRILAMIHGVQMCNGKDKCTYQYTVKEQRIPESIADGVNYVKAICGNDASKIPW